MGSTTEQGRLYEDKIEKLLKLNTDAVVIRNAKRLGTSGIERDIDLLIEYPYEVYFGDVLIYWRDFAANWAYQFAGERAFFWHSSAKCIAELQPDDRMWMVTSGKGLREGAEQAAELKQSFRD